MAANVAMFLLLVIVGFDKINEVCGPWVFAAWAIINIANLIAAILNHSFEWILPW
jgi:hypothetical protein